jgi:hypothetical protein
MVQVVEREGVKTSRPRTGDTVQPSSPPSCPQPLYLLPELLQLLPHRLILPGRASVFLPAVSFVTAGHRDQILAAVLHQLGRPLPLPSP